MVKTQMDVEKQLGRALKKQLSFVGDSPSPNGKSRRRNSFIHFLSFNRGKRNNAAVAQVPRRRRAPPPPTPRTASH